MQNDTNQPQIDLSKWPELFSPNRQQRYLATQQFIAINDNHVCEAPEACWGSANGWTMFVGPSPGSAKSGDEVDAEQNRSRKSQLGMLIGKASGEIKFNGSSTRSTHWNKLAAASAMGNVEHASALTTVCNLDFLNWPGEKDTPLTRLMDGCPVVFGVMQKTRPRLVLPLTIRVYQLLGRYIADNGLLKRAEVSPLNKRRELVWFRIPGCDWDSLLILTPKHPSRFPSNDSLRRLSELVQEKLAVDDLPSGSV